MLCGLTSSNVTNWTDAKCDFPLNVCIRGSWNIFAISPAFLAGLFVARSFVPLQLAPSPMRVFTRWIKLPLDVPVQRSQDADARHHGGPVELDDQEQGFDRGLPLLEQLFGLGSFWI